MEAPSRKRRRWFFWECRDASGKLHFASIYLEGQGGALEFVERHYYKTKKKLGIAELLSISEKIGEQVIESVY